MDYAGDIEVTEVWRRLSVDTNAVLIDVRTQAEWNYVGLPDLSSLSKEVLRIEWQFFPGSGRNTDFQAQVEGSEITKDAAIYLLCRSGVRSKNAAILLTSADFKTCYNVADGFEGDKSQSGHRGTVGGWKFSGLPWVQG